MEIIRVDLLFNGKHIISFDDDDSFHDLFVTINDLFTYDDISNLSLKIVALPSEKVKESIDDDSDVPNLGKDFKEVLVDKYSFKPEDITTTFDSVILFNDPENWTVTLTGDEDLDEIAQFLYEQAKNDNLISESDNSKGYKYILKHGFGPGTLPKDVEILTFNDLDDYRTEIYLDRPLTEDELNFYDIPSETKLSPIKEYYVEDNPGEYTIWSSSNLMDDHYQIPLVKVKTDDNGDLYAEPVGDSDFDKESLKIATSSLANSKKAGKNVKDTLIRLDKTLNHSDPFFSVDLDRNNANSGLELIAAQTLRTLRDDLKAVLTKKGVTEEDVVAKYAELTGVDYYTDEIIDEDQYNQILILLMKDPKDKYNYVSPKENEFIQRTKDLTEDLIEKVLLKNDPDFYK